jgi:hypothetical protein
MELTLCYLFCSQVKMDFGPHWDFRSYAQTLCYLASLGYTDLDHVSLKLSGL